MTALVDADDIREHTDTDLSDTALGQLIDAADSDIVGRYGAHTTAITERFTPGTNDLYLFTQRPIASITSVTESYSGAAGEQTDTLTASDYEHMGGSQLRRREGGDYSSPVWAPRVVVVYTPVSDNARRVLVTINLVKLDLAYEALKASNVGDVGVTHVQYVAERESLLASLQPSFLGSFA